MCARGRCEAALASINYAYWLKAMQREQELTRNKTCSGTIPIGYLLGVRGNEGCGPHNCQLANACLHVMVSTRLKALTTTTNMRLHMMINRCTRCWLSARLGTSTSSTTKLNTWLSTLWSRRDLSRGARRLSIDFEVRPGQALRVKRSLHGLKQTSEPRVVLATRKNPLRANDSQRATQTCSCADRKRRRTGFLFSPESMAWRLLKSRMLPRARIKALTDLNQ